MVLAVTGRPAAARATLRDRNRSNTPNRIPLRTIVLLCLGPALLAPRDTTRLRLRRSPCAQGRLRQRNHMLGQRLRSLQPPQSPSWSSSSGVRSTHVTRLAQRWPWLHARSGRYTADHRGSRQQDRRPGDTSIVPPMGWLTGQERTPRSSSPLRSCGQRWRQGLFINQVLQPLKQVGRGRGRSFLAITETWDLDSPEVARAVTRAQYPARLVPPKKTSTTSALTGLRRRTSARRPGAIRPHMISGT